jgi:hypothetical protein
MPQTSVVLPCDVEQLPENRVVMKWTRPCADRLAMSHNAFTISEPIAPQEASPMQQEMRVLGIAIAKRVFHAVGMENTGKVVRAISRSLSRINTG